MTGRLNFDEDDSVTVVQGPTLRWVTKPVVITSKLHKDQYGNWQTYDVVEQQRVLQQAVMTDKAPGHIWVDVPEVEDVR